MISISTIQTKDEARWKLFRRTASVATPKPILKQLSKKLGRELSLRIKEAHAFSGSFYLAEATHAAIDNLNNSKRALDEVLRSDGPLSAEFTLRFLERQMAETKELLEMDMIAESSEATQIGVRTLNLLFCAKQAIKQDLSVTDRRTVETDETDSSVEPGSRDSPPFKNYGRTTRLVLSSTLLYQIHHSLFPAERMLVGAGIKKGKVVHIDGIFDVTGDANSGGVKAHPDRLARALIVMSETERYFAFWIHSHPGRGPNMTFPSSTDRNQEADWLNDFSPNLVNAIVVEDGFLRFWGKAIEKGVAKIEVAGSGISKVAESDHLYRLEF